MKTLLSVIKSLIQINFVIAVFSVVFVMAVRERKTETVFTPQPSAPPNTFRHEIKENLSADQREILASRQKIQQYEQALEEQKAELEHYKTQESIKSPQPEQTSTFANSQQTPFGNANPSPKSKQPSTSVPKQAHSMATSGNANSANISQKPQVLPMPLVTAQPSSRRVVAGSGSPKLPSQQPNRQLPSPSASTTSRTSQAVGTPPPSSTNSRLLLAQDNRQIPAPSFTSHFDLSFKLLRPELPKSLPNSPKIATRTAEQEIASDSTPKTAPAPANHLANDITMGLLIAGRKGYINYGTRTYRKVQTAIRSLRNRKSNDIHEAARLAKLSPDLLKKLAKSGEDRPGNLENSPISLGIQP